MLGVKHGVFWSWVTGWVGSPCCSTACIPAWTALDTPSACLLPYCLHSCLACSRHTKRICTVLKCVVQINLLGQLAFVAGNEYTVVQVATIMILLGTGTATGGGYLMSYAEMCHARLQLSNTNGTVVCS